MLNLLKVFSPELRDLTEEEAKDCVPCQVVAGSAALLGGAYLASGRVFHGQAPGTHPESYVRSVRGAGGAVLLLGIYRLGQGWLWDREREYRLFLWR